MKQFIIACSSFLILVSGYLLAQVPEQPEVVKQTIFDKLSDNSDQSKGVIVIHQDDKIKNLLYRKKDPDVKSKTYSTQPGYRVQIFSSNEQRTAKADAYKAEAMIKEKLPDMTVYVTYFSPFWKVRVGDCVSTAEAQALREELKKTIPEFKQETYIVKDQVLIPED